jgi:hypothetical protein
MVSATQAPKPKPLLYMPWATEVAQQGQLQAGEEDGCALSSHGNELTYVAHSDPDSMLAFQVAQLA